MATLILPQVFINNMATGLLVAAYAGPERRRTVGREGDVRTYGNGRRRGVTRVGKAHEMPLRLVQLHQSSVDLLEEWEGESVLYRDDRGRRFVAIYLRLDDREYVADKQRYDVALTLNEVSWVEGVPA
ncbi:hypothetical protein [Micromonospora aurantiaca (nom. illeg.)]|uniref:Uncharacterized protein n=1 Tax=Micromonospora aurantiaca (nom. illeg.) TaxID=47850 RepID=A0ABQ6UGE1_9ACTN|nr:hypothetical protein [Micromonospora aurantiaca]KAB1111968.1 hypothetical protein F6X54_15955 [Micromonospora aurantiaca]